MLEALSLRSWDQDDPHEMLGAHVLLPGVAQSSHLICVILFRMQAQASSFSAWGCSPGAV